MSARCLAKVAHRSPVTGGSRHGSRVDDADAVVVNPVLELVVVEADVAAHLDDGNTTLVGQPAHVTLAGAQAERNLFEGEKAGWRTQFATDGAAEHAAGGRAVSGGGLPLALHR
jgi:hypothetical protein